MTTEPPGDDDIWAELSAYRAERAMRRQVAKAEAFALILCRCGFQPEDLMLCLDRGKKQVWITVLHPEPGQDKWGNPKE